MFKTISINQFEQQFNALEFQVPELLIKTDTRPINKPDFINSQQMSVSYIAHCYLQKLFFSLSCISKLKKNCSFKNKTVSFGVCFFSGLFRRYLL